MQIASHVRTMTGELGPAVMGLRDAGRQEEVQGATTNRGYHQQPFTLQGNTAVLVREVFPGAAERGADVEEIFLPEHSLRFCTGCFHCRSEGGCPLPDHFEEIRRMPYTSDGMILGSPAYCQQPNAIVKNLFDRLGHLHPVQIAAGWQVYRRAVHGRRLWRRQGRPGAGRHRVRYVRPWVRHRHSGTRARLAAHRAQARGIPAGAGSSKTTLLLGFEVTCDLGGQHNWRVSSV